MTQSKVLSHPADENEAVPHNEAIRLANVPNDVEARIDNVSEQLQRLNLNVERLVVVLERELRQPFRISLVPRNWRVYIWRCLRAAIYAIIATAAGWAIAQLLPDLAQIRAIVVGWQATL